MCTGLSFKNGDHQYFGRTLDVEYYCPVSVTIVPHHYDFKFRHVSSPRNHYAMIGMGFVQDDYPLLFEAVNEKGLGMAGLALWNSCHYFPVQEGKTNVASFEIIPYILASCQNVQEAKDALQNINITDEMFTKGQPNSPLHWLISDENESIVLESTKDGVHVYENPYQVLTNEPPFPFHEMNLNYYCNVSNHIENFDRSRFAREVPNFKHIGAGLGTTQLPGGLDPISRFVRVAYLSMNSVTQDTEQSNVSQFFHILQGVSQPLGANQNKPNDYEYTQYTCCINTKTLRFYYSTYDNQSLNAVDLKSENLDRKQIITYPVIHDFQVNVQNKVHKS